MLVVVLLVLLAGVLLYEYWWLPRQAEGVNPEKLIGGDKDEYGCLIAAGYSWCEVKQKCLRTWEEECAAGEGFFVEIGNLVKNGGNWSLIYEEPGAPALKADLAFNEDSVCDFIEGHKCLASGLNVGDRLRVEGQKQGGTVTVSKLTRYE